MSQQTDIGKAAAYWIIAAGSVLALVTALAPQPTGAFRLSGAFLMLGLLPYIVYGSFSAMFRCCPLITAGVALLLVDIAARLGAGVIHVDHASAMPAVYLSLIMTLLVLPAGAAIGKLTEKFWL
ncbi:hypothetical protein DFR30_2007 [Thiogranum longum]|uniref:Uncharacterized protein n=1 Tax=Thiogranum longum TaxID=1537524 RepID=A0A4R1HDL4_9GAMM|nr:hypothetical protein [Thiogranum longum]TCK18723.1 hypothetical protein DFR30_2007 [Thiogranum longum]